MGIIDVAAVIEKNGKFLLVQEAQEICKGKWDIPGGLLDPNETIFDGVKREVFEECGCKVEVSGVLNIANRVLNDNTFIGIVFATKLIEENINFDPKEILDVKWFTYEEIVNMKEKLRSSDWIINSISAVKENKIADINMIKVLSGGLS